MKTQPYISPFVQIYFVQTERMFALSYNETNRTETMSRDIDEEDL